MAQIHKDLAKYFGNQTKTAQALGVKQASVSKWCTDRNKMKFEYALKAEQLTGGKFNKYDLIGMVRVQESENEKAHVAVTTQAQLSQDSTPVTTNSQGDYNTLETVNQSTEQTMSSREIAELCSKEHFNVKRDIEVMCMQLGIDVTKFEYIYLDSYNREQTEYHLDKTLSLTLVSGYNATLRYKIIVRWQELENSQPQQMSEIELLHAMTGRMVENERLQKQLASKVQGIESELHEVKAIQSAIYQNNNHFAVMGFARLHNIKLPNEVAASLSRKAKHLSNEKGILIGQTSDTRYGTVKTYHEDILKQVFISEGFIH